MNIKQINKAWDKRVARLVETGQRKEYKVASALYTVTQRGELMEVSTRNVIRRGNDCREYAKRMGLQLAKGGQS